MKISADWLNKPSTRLVMERLVSRGYQAYFVGGCVRNTLLNIETYRFKGHSMSDPQKYRTKDEVISFKDRDPISYVRGVLLEQNWMSEAELKDIEAGVKKVIEEAVTFAEESPKPEADELYKDVYTQEDYPFVKD